MLGFLTSLAYSDATVLHNPRNSNKSWRFSKEEWCFIPSSESARHAVHAFPFLTRVADRTFLEVLGAFLIAGLTCKSFRVAKLKQGIREVCKETKKSERISFKFLRIRWVTNVTDVISGYFWHIHHRSCNNLWHLHTSAHSTIPSRIWSAGGTLLGAEGVQLNDPTLGDWQNWAKTFRNPSETCQADFPTSAFGLISMFS